MTAVRDIYERSPLRELDRSLGGGLGPGDVGVVCAGHGAGKTAFLVSVALDRLMGGGQVLHVAVDQPVERIRNYYDEIFAETAREARLERAGELRVQLERNRWIHAFQASTFRVDGLAEKIGFLRQNTSVRPDLIVLDGYEWDQGSEADLRSLRSLAVEQSAALWMTAVVDRARPVTHPGGVPDPVARFEPLVDVILRLKGEDGAAHLTILKGREGLAAVPLALKLDPTTLLVR